MKWFHDPELDPRTWVWPSVLHWSIWQSASDSPAVIKPSWQTSNQTAHGLFKQRVPVAVKVSPEHIPPRKCKHKAVYKEDYCFTDYILMFFNSVMRKVICNVIPYSTQCIIVENLMMSSQDFRLRSRHKKSHILVPTLNMDVCVFILMFWIFQFASWKCFIVWCEVGISVTVIVKSNSDSTFLI